MRMTTLIAMSVLSIGAAAPALAQDAMASDHMKSGAMMKMSGADTRKMKSCGAMSHDMMMKNAGCMRMMKKHPDMMKGDAMMKDDHGMMKSGH